MKKKFKLLLGIVFIIFVSLIIAFLFDLRTDVRNSGGVVQEGVVSLTFDDGYLVHYETAFGLMEESGFDGTIYILADLAEESFEGKDLMSFEQALEMQEAGWEIGSHTLDHSSLITLSDQELEDQLGNSKFILEEKGFNIESIAFPFGYYNDGVLDKTKQYYSSARPLSWGYNNLNYFNVYRLKSKWIKNHHSSRDVCKWVEHAKANGKWLILDFHHIGDKAEKPFDTSVDVFREVLECIKDTGIKVKTVREVVNEKRN